MLSKNKFFFVIFFLSFFHLVLADTKTRTGIEISWFQADSWDPLGVPSVSDDIFFNSLSASITMADLAQMKSLTVESLPGGQITGTLFLFGTSPSQIYIENSDSFTFDDLTIDSPSLDVNIYTSSDTAYINSIGGTGAFNKSGLGILHISTSFTSSGTLTISEGTLSIPNISDLTPSTIHLAGGGLEIFNPASTTKNFVVRGYGTINNSDDLTIYGDIATDTGTSYSLIKEGLGNLDLLGNIDSNLTQLEINEGSLYVDPVKIDCDIQNNSVLTFFSDNPIVYNRNINGIGSFNKAGAGLITLSGNNTFSGVFIYDGTLEVYSLQNTGYIYNYSDLILNQLTDETYAKIISGTGSFTKAGAYKLTLSGVNTCTGDISIDDGTLQGTTSSLFGNITNNSDLIFDQELDGEYSGAISSSGTFEKKGSGMVTLSGNNTYTGDTTITGGALQGTTSSLLGNIVNNSHLTFDQNGDGTYTGDMFGVGTFEKKGSGTVTLSGEKYYTGRTTVTEGILQVTTSSLSGNITNNAALIFDFDDSYAGDISGTGTFTKSGLSHVILSGNNTYTGGTAIEEGYLFGTTSSLSGIIINNAVLVFDQTVDGTYAGDMSGSGSLDIGGSGIVTLSGNNTYTGGTSIGGGTLKGTTSSLSGDIENYSLVIFDQNGDGTYSGDVQGNGTFEKEGRGKIIYNGSSFSQSLVTITDGNFSIQSPITATNMTIGNSGMLSGISTVTGSVNCEGEISPGNSPGTIIIDGELTFAAGSTYNVEFSPTVSDLIYVTGAPGTVTIDTGSSVVFTPDFGLGSYTPTSYVIIDTDNGVTGTFTEVYSAYPAFRGYVSYEANQVLYHILQTRDFADLVVGEGNVYATSKYVDSLVPLPGSDLDYVIENIQFLQVDQMEEAFDQMHPAIFKGMHLTQENNSSRVTSVISNRAKSEYATCCTRERDCRRSKSISTWLTPFGDFLGQGNYSDLHGFDVKTGGALLGIDYNIAQNAHIGVTSGYTYSDIDWNEDRGEADINSFYGGLYSFWYNEHLFVNASVLGSFNAYSGKRNIKFFQIDRVAENNHNGGEVIGHIDGGAIFRLTKKSNIEIRPILALDYTFIHESAFEETGANSLNLSVDSENYQLWRTEIGLNFARCFVCCKGNFIPDIGITWVREIRDGSKYYTTNFANEPGNFIVYGMNKNADLVSPKASLTYTKFNNKVNFSLGYKGEFGSKRQDNTVYLEMLLNF